MTDVKKLIADGKAFVESWDRLGSWTLDSPVGMVMQMTQALEAVIAERDALGEVAFEAYRATGANEHGAQNWCALFLPVDRHAWRALVSREIERIIEDRTRAEEELDAINEGRHDADS